MSNSLWSHGLQDTRLPCPSPTRSLLKVLSIKSVMPSNHLILCCPLLLLPWPFPASGSLPMSQFFPTGGQSTGVWASASILPMTIQDWFPLGLTGLISLQSKGLRSVKDTTRVHTGGIYPQVIFTVITLVTNHSAGSGPFYIRYKTFHCWIMWRPWESYKSSQES